MPTKRQSCGLALLALIALLLALVPTVPHATAQEGLAPTYRIYATREGLVGYMTANGHVIQERDRFVALPSWQALASYQGYEFQVRVTYNGRTTVLPVWDVGPWNTNDAYWSPNRGDYPDLPLGMPQAQAAYFDGHNGGLDEFGRRITIPNGIDIADGAYWDDLGMSGHDWVKVSFLWLGRDPGPGAAVQAPAPAPPPEQPAPAQPAPEQPAAPPPEQPAAPAPEPTPYPLDNPQVAAGAIAVDNSDSAFQGSAGWDTFFCGLNGDHAWALSTTDTSSSAAATWQPSLESGAYAVAAYIPPCGDTPATASASYEISADSGLANVTIDQAAAAGTWVPLGTFHFGREGAPRIVLSSQAAEQGRAVRADALAFTLVPDSLPPAARFTRMVKDRTGYTLEWTGEDDLSGVGSYDVQVRQLPRGQWRLWVDNQPATSSWFGPDEGRDFAFRVRARDMAGNVQPWEEGHVMETMQAERPES